MWKLAISQGKVGSRVALLGLYFIFGFNWRWICWHPHLPIYVSYIKPGMSTTSGSLGVECFQMPLVISVELWVSSSCISFPGSVQFLAEHVHRLNQTFYSSGTLLYGGFLASYSSQHVGRHSSMVSYHKKIL